MTKLLKMTKLPSTRISFWWSAFVKKHTSNGYNWNKRQTPSLSSAPNTAILTHHQHFTMARLANLNGVSEALPAIPKFPHFKRTQKKTTILGFHGNNKPQEFQEQQQMPTTRRMAIGLASIALFGNVGNGNSLADDNGYWLNGPLPKRQVQNSKFSHWKTRAVKWT